MTTRIAQFVRAHNDVVDADFLAHFPGLKAVKADNLEDFAKALEGAEILGAERLCRMVRRVNPNSGADLNSQYLGLIKEMKLVLPSLEKNISTLKQQG